MDSTLAPDRESLSILNPCPRRLLGPTLLHHLVAKSSLDGGSALEYRAPDGTRSRLTYQELHRVSEILAARIAGKLHRNAEKPAVVPVILPQSPQLYITLLAILKAGCAFCPLNPDAPRDRIRFVLEDLQASLVLASPELAPLVSGFGNVEVLVVDDGVLRESNSLDRPTRKPQAQDMAYVMYTSGSTGTPKGVGISHGAATQALLAHDRHIPVFRRFLQFAAPTFDVSIFEIFFPLFRGATLISCSRAEMVSDLPAVLNEMAVDACELTPTVAGSLLKRRENAPGLRLLLTIGEMLTPPVVEEFGGRADRPSCLWAMYGPTEATIHCTLQPSFEAGSSVGMIGAPLDTVSVYVLEITSEGNDAQLHEPRVLPVGEEGELAVGGHQLAAGYLNRPEQTKAAFVETQYGRLYRTGDRARVRHDGTIECLGRISDGQVKLRGQRIELGEVEHAALQAQGCHGAVASVVTGSLVLFCTVDRRPDIDKEILQACRSWLPKFMVPSDVVLMHEFPRLPSGKTDRKRLSLEYAESTRPGPSANNLFADDLERQLCEAAESILGSPVDSAAVLSQRGMDSLQSIRYASTLRNFGLHVSALEILASRTLRDLYLVVDARQKSERSQSLPPPKPGLSPLFNLIRRSEVPAIPHERLGDVEDAFECTPLQASMLAETTANPIAYCNSIELQFPHDKTPDQIVAAFQSLGKENPILRTGFFHYQGNFAQAVWKSLGQSQILVVRDFDHRFSLETDTAMLQPFRVQIRNPSEDGGSRALVQIHHALYDGWSADLILQDLDTHLRGKAVPQRPAFRSVVEHQLSTPKSVRDAAKQFWAESLLGFQPPPAAAFRETTVGPRQVLTGSRQVRLHPQELRSFSKSLDISPQVCFQAALLWLWGGLVSREDVVIGSVHSGRTGSVPHIDQIMGPCLETAPLRCDLSKAQSISELLDQVHAANRASLPYSSLPLLDIKKVAGFLPGQALYNVIFVYQESLYSDRRDDFLVKEVGRLDNLETGLLVEVEPRESHFACRITYRTEEWSPAQAEMLMEQFCCIATHFKEHVGMDVSSTWGCFPPLLLSRHNITPPTFSGTTNVAALVCEASRRIPDSPAICFATSVTNGSPDTEIVTYRELDRMSSRIASLLHTCGASEGSVIAIIMEKSVILYEGILGILKAGCAYLPLLPSTPVARIAAIFRQADVRLCLTDAAAKQALGRLDCKLLELEALDLPQICGDSPPMWAPSTKIANIIYTSGTSGTPKGVAITHVNITSNLDALSRIYPVGENPRLLQSCSQAFDVSVFEIFFSWTRGMCLCAAVNDVLFADLERTIRLLDVTHLSMTPTVAALVRPEAVPRVTFLVTAGEPMTEELARRWGVRLYQGYGPSEVTNICTVKKMGPGHHPRHLGHALRNTSAFVLRQGSLDLAPLGLVGELCFGGDQVALGYLNSPSRTSETFIQHPLYGRLYRSGDLGRMLPDGSLMIIGRQDDQVKLRGQRVELEEINTAAAQSDDISAAATLLLSPNNAGSQQLVTFYVTKTAKTLSLDLSFPEARLRAMRVSLFQRLRAHLPGYMIPSHVVPLSALPLTPAGKVDKALLRKTFGELTPEHLEKTNEIEETEGAAEWGATERDISAAVSDTFGVDQAVIRLWTPLSTLGLDSISAIRLARLLRERHGWRLPISTVLQSASVAQLSAVLTRTRPVEEQRVASLDVFSPEFHAGLRRELQQRNLTAEQVLPCTPLQEAMLASRPGQQAYLNTVVFEIQRPAERMKTWWSMMSQRHGILRTCFVTTDSPEHAVAQVVLADHAIDWQDFIISTQGFRTRNSCVDDQTRRLPPPTNSYKPLVSFAIIHEGGARFLSFVCHHALYDGEAVSRLFFEVEQVANGKILPEPPSYNDFLSGSLCLPPSTDAFWAAQLRGFQPSLLLPLDKKQNSRQLTKSGRLRSLLSDLEQTLRSTNVTLLSACQASWALTLMLLAKTDDVCFGNVFSGRSATMDRIDELVAPCFNTVPFRINSAGVKLNSDLLQMVQALNIATLEYQFTPLRRIQKQAYRGHPIFNTLLLLQTPARPLDGDIWLLRSDEGDMDLPIVCEIIPNPHENSVAIRLCYQDAFLSQKDAHLVYDLFCHIFDTLIDFPFVRLVTHNNLPEGLSRRLGKLDMRLDAPERRIPLSAVPGPEEPWTPLEKLIRSVLARLSSVAECDIGRETTIYRLGLDSISAVQAASMLRQLGVITNPSDILEFPTCSSLASALERNREVVSKPEYDIAGFRARLQGQKNRSHRHIMDDDKTVLPCTPLQCSMLLEFGSSEGKNYMNFIDLLMTDTSLDACELKRAWEAVVVADPILRTGFISVDDSDTPFAMVEYSVDENSPRISLLAPERSKRFNSKKWRLDMARETLKNLETPPWKVVMRATARGTIMHLAIHHVLYDAHSVRGLLNRFRIILGGGSPPPLPSTEAVVLDLMGQAGAATQQSGFWESLASKVVVNRFPIMTPLRVDDSRTVVISSACSSSMDALNAAARHSGVTLQAILQAAWTRVLAAYVGEDSVVFGVVLSGRNTDITKDASFPCITTLPIVARDTPSNRGLLEQMMEYNKGLQKSHHARISWIQKRLKHPEPHLFDTLLVCQKPEAAEVAGSVPWTVLEDTAAVEYPVSIEAEPCGNRFLFTLRFSDDVLPQEQAALLLGQFDAALCHLALYPDESKEDLFRHSPLSYSIIAPRETTLPSDESLLHHFVESRARNAPDTTALRFVSSLDHRGVGFRDWTYKQLDESGNKAASIVSAHAQPGSIVAVCFEKCPEVYFAILGILKSGCSFVALDPGAPLTRKQFILGDSGATLLLADAVNAASFVDPVGTPLVILSESMLEQVVMDPTAYAEPISPSATCYCLYTSGTTGVPKGCEISHENAVQALLAFQRLFEGQWDHESRWLQFASLHFDVSVLEQYWSWSVGIMLVAAPRDVILEDLPAAITRLGITHIDLTPSLAQLLHPKDVPSLCRGVFITGGEQLRQEILDAWGHTGVIHNFYGPTEATIGVTSYSHVPQNGRPSNIGKQFPNVGAYVLVPDTETPVLRGGVGELCLAGKLVGKGYLNQPTLTEQRFPTLKYNGERVYRTGDLVRLLHDGCFDFLGRADEQVKLRGQRMETAEINHVIKDGIPEVADATTLVVRRGRDKDILVSFYVLAPAEASSGPPQVILGPDNAVMGQRIQQACRSRLPGYMVPTFILRISSIPLSVNNKVDAKALRRVFAEVPTEHRLGITGTHNVGHRHNVATSPSWPILIQALRSMGVLQEDADPPPESSIYDIGMDSISVIRLSRALRREGLDAPPSLLLQNPRFADLAGALVSAGASKDASLTVEARLLVEVCRQRHMGLVCDRLGLRPGEVDYIAPCTALQSGMLSRSWSPEHQGAYFNAFRLNLSPDIDAGRLQRAWQLAVDRHSILRTRFVPTSEGFVQVAVTRMNMPWRDLALTGGQELDTILAGRRDAWINTNHGAVTVPLEALLVQWQEQKILVLHIFHALYDAIGLELLLGQVAAWYTGARPDDDGPSFLDAMLDGPLRNHSHGRNFWEKHLKGVSPTPLTRLVNSTEKASAKDAMAKRTVAFQALGTMQKQLQATHASMVQALWVSVLGAVRGGGVTIGVVVAGRSSGLEGVQEVVGPLFNTIPFHAEPASSTTWANLVRSCQDFNTCVLPLQQTPLRDIQKWCTGGKPLFDTLFSFHLEDKVPSGGTSAPWTQVASETVADYALALEATLTAGGLLELLLVARREFADEAGLERLLDEFETAAKALSTNPQDLLAVSQHRLPFEQVKRLPRPSSTRLGSPECKRPDFQWTNEAAAMRAEISLLADVPMESVAEETSLLELGLDSIDAIKLSARLKSRGIVLTRIQLLRGQTIASFAAMAAPSEANSDHSQQQPVAKRNFEKLSSDLEDSLISQGYDLTDVESILPPTPLQEAMAAEMIQSGFRKYFNHDIMEVSNATDLSRLKNAWETVARHNPILRTGFVEVVSPELDVTFCQVVKRSVDLSCLDISTCLDSPDGLQDLIEKARLFAEKGGGADGLFQLRFASVGTRHYVLLSIAHALYDGWSLQLLHGDVRAAYDLIEVRRESYHDYLGDILHTAESGTETFWAGYLSTAVPTCLAAKHSRGPGQAEECTLRSQADSLITAHEALEFCKKHNISLQVLAQASWAAVLSKLSGSLDVTFGVVLSGRDSEEAEELMFPTMNTVPVRVIMHGKVSDLLRYMQDNMFEVHRFQHFPLRKARTAAGVHGQDLLNTLFLLQRTSRPDAGTNGLTQSVGGTANVEFPVCIELEVSQDALLWRTACDIAFLSAHETANALHELDAALRFLIDSPESNVLHLEGESVSVCGLPPFGLQRLADEIAQQRPRSVVAPGDGEAWTHSEEALREVLAQMSGIPIPSISKLHTAYSLGLDSISSIKAVAMLRARGVKLSVRDMLKADSIPDMALMAERRPQGSGGDGDADSRDAISSALAGVGATALVQRLGMDASTVETVLPATAMQVHMLSAWENSGGRLFFPVFHYRIQGPTSKDILEKAWGALVAEHPILRTTFVATGSRGLPFLQVARRPSPSREFSEREQLLGTSDLTNLASLSVMVEGDGCHVIAIHLHHALYDGISLPILLERYSQLCLGAAPGQLTPSSLPTWESFVGNQVSELARGRRRTFWERYLKGAQSTRHPTSETPATRGPRVAKFRPAAIADVVPLRKMCAQHGIGLQCLFFAAYAQVLGRWQAEGNSPGKDVVFGIYLANRGSDAALGTLPFPTLSLIPLCVRDPAERGVVDIARRIARDLHEISSPDNASAGLWEIKDWTGVEITSFVNFLNLPNLPEMSSRKRAMLEEVDGPLAHTAPTAPTSTPDPEAYRLLGNNVVRDAYLDAVDVEVALRGDEMDIGVFGVENLLAPHDVEMLLGEIVTALRAL